jgi:tetratricopeptide (TPR) repeat protein
MTPKTPPPPSPRRRLYAAAAAVALVTFAVYLPALFHQFVDWDDGTYVFDNPHLRTINADFFAWAFLRFYSSNWHPLTWLSHGVDWAIWGTNPLGHHLANNLFHAANAGIVTLLVYRLLDVARERTPVPHRDAIPDEGRTLVAAGVTGLLFGLHPIHVESVAWVAERKDLLCALFYILAIIAYLRRASGEAADSRGAGPLFSVGDLPCLFLFALALLSKPMAVTLPVILLLLDWYPLRRFDSLRGCGRAALAKLPFLALSLGSAVVTVLAQKAGGALASTAAVPPGARLAVAGKALAVYLGKLILPLHLVPFYPYPNAAALFSFPTFAAIAAVAGMSLYCLARARTERLWLTLWGYYVVTLLPVLGIVQVGRQAMADRYAYLPSLAPLLVAGLAAAWIAARSRQGTAGAALAVLGIALVLGGLTLRQLRVWQDSITLWNAVIAANPPEKLDFAYNNRAIAWHRQGELDKAAADFTTAIAVNPGDADYYANRGTIYSRLRRYDEALADYRKAIEIRPDNGGAYYNVACIHALRGNVAEACDWLRKSVEHGYDSWEEIKADHDLDAIRGSACYREVMAGR